MKILLLAASASLMLAVGNSASGRPVQRMTSVCAATDSYATGEVSSFRNIVRSSDPDTVAWRNVVHLPAAADTDVVAVSDSTTCARGLAAYNSALSDTTVSSVYLIRVSTSYVASNPQLRTGEYVQHFVFDSAFVLRSQIMH